MSRPAVQPDSAPPSERLAKLHDVAALVNTLAGVRSRAIADMSTIDGAYEAGSTLARARFDDLATQAVALASTGVEALLASGEVPPAALATLADAIESEIAQLEALLVA